VGPDTLRRLAFIRLLLARSVSMSQEEPPYSFDSVNRLHDVTEMFLVLAVQEKGESIQNNFMDYWKVLAKALGRPLNYQAQFQKFNKLRVGLKHYGIDPPATEIAAARESVVALLTNECLDLFSLELEDISLASLIRCEESQLLFREAEEAWPDNKLEVFGKLAESFETLVRDYEKRKVVGYGKSRFRSVGRLASPEQSDSTDREQLARSRKRQNFDEQLISALESLDFSVMLLSLGVDYRKYGKFRMLTPWIIRPINGAIIYDPNFQRDPTKEDYEFCRDFVLQTALRFTEFDYDSGQDLSVNQRLGRPSS
jgi:hypothetical protein